MIKYTIQLNKNQIKFLETGLNGNFCIHDLGSAFVDDLGWNNRKAKNVARSLYGIICTHQSSGLQHTKEKFTRYKIFWYGVAHEILSHVQKALQNRGIFEIEIQEKDLGVLSALYYKNKELKEKYGNKWSPKFHPTEIAKLSGKGKKFTRKSLDRLLGITARTRIQQLIWTYNKGGECSRTIYAPRWFLPFARIKDAEKILKIY